MDTVRHCRSCLAECVALAEATLWLGNRVRCSPWCRALLAVQAPHLPSTMGPGMVVGEYVSFLCLVRDGVPEFTADGRFSQRPDSVVCGLCWTRPVPRTGGAGEDAEALLSAVDRYNCVGVLYLEENHVYRKAAAAALDATPSFVESRYDERFGRVPTDLATSECLRCGVWPARNPVHCDWCLATDHTKGSCRILGRLVSALRSVRGDLDIVSDDVARILAAARELRRSGSRDDVPE